MVSFQWRVPHWLNLSLSIQSPRRPPMHHPLERAPESPFRQSTDVLFPSPLIFRRATLDLRAMTFGGSLSNFCCRFLSMMRVWTVTKMTVLRTNVSQNATMSIYSKYVHLYAALCIFVRSTVYRWGWFCTKRVFSFGLQVFTKKHVSGQVDFDPEISYHGKCVRAIVTEFCLMSILDKKVRQTQSCQIKFIHNLNCWQRGSPRGHEVYKCTVSSSQYRIVSRSGLKRDRDPCDTLGQTEINTQSRWKYNGNTVFNASGSLFTT
jgi:hypothetical protein